MVLYKDNTGTFKKMWETQKLRTYNKLSKHKLS